MFLMATDQLSPAMRLRITFAKTEKMRYTSHLDLHRAWERTVRRAGLPLAYSHGFNPRPKLNLASALPLGFTSDCELIDIWLESKMRIKDIKTTLGSTQPPGLEIVDVHSVDLDTPKLQKQLSASEYLITILETIPDLNSRLQRILDSDSIIRNRRGKDYDLRILIEEAAYLSPSDAGHQQISLRLKTQENATGRPDEVLAELEIPIHKVNIKRIRLILI
jgi:radical SAM-linked protein